MTKIESITEAYSMQPITHQVELSGFRISNKKGIERIELENIVLGTRCGDPFEEMFYVGYDFHGNKMFQFLANSVNVNYYEDEKTSV